MPPADIDELFAQTLRGAYDDEAPWEAVHSLRRIGTRQVFETAVERVESPSHSCAHEALMSLRNLARPPSTGQTAFRRSATVSSARLYSVNVIYSPSTRLSRL